MRNMLEAKQKEFKELAAKLIMTPQDWLELIALDKLIAHLKETQEEDGYEYQN